MSAVGELLLSDADTVVTYLNHKLPRSPPERYLEQYLKFRDSARFSGRGASRGSFARRNLQQHVEKAASRGHFMCCTACLAALIDYVNDAGPSLCEE
jgi:hypothetical protein